MCHHPAIRPDRKEEPPLSSYTTIINSHVFQEQSYNLLCLSDAIKDIGRRVMNITHEFPDSFGEQVDGLLDRELATIDSICHCLGLVALEASNNAEKWKVWAEEDKVKMFLTA